MDASRPVRKPDITVKQVGSEVIVFGRADKEIHVLNATAKLIWDLCDGKHTVEEIEASIRSRFSVPPESNLTEDIQKTLRVFDQKGLLVHSQN